MRILLADDDGELRLAIGSMLRYDGHEVVEVRDGCRLLDEVGTAIMDGATIPADLIITDQRMPGVTGLSLLAGLRQSDLTTPVVLMTAFATPEFHREAARLGARVMDKPFSFDALRRCVAEAVRRA